MIGSSNCHIQLRCLQNGDDTTRDVCLDALVCSSRIAEVKKAAQDYAQTMTELNQVLLPIPHYAVACVLSPAGSQIFH